MRRVADQGRDIIDRLLAKVIIPLLPFLHRRCLCRDDSGRNRLRHPEDLWRGVGDGHRHALALALGAVRIGTGLALGRSPADAHQEHAARLLHRPGHHVQRSYHSGCPASQQEQRRERWHRQLHRAPVRHHPPVWLHHHAGDLCHRRHVPSPSTWPFRA